MNTETSESPRPNDQLEDKPQQRAETETSKATIPLSESWQKRFDLLEKVGADHLFVYAFQKTPEYKALKLKEKFSIIFNVWAFFLGSFYYFFKGMWLKGALLLAVSWIYLSLIDALIASAGSSWSFLYIIIPIIYAVWANHDYFKQVRHEEKMWAWAPKACSKPIFVIVILVASIILGCAIGSLT